MAVCQLARVTFRYNGTTLGTGAISVGNAIFSKKTLPAGPNYRNLCRHGGLQFGVGFSHADGELGLIAPLQSPSHVLIFGDSVPSPRQSWEQAEIHSGSFRS